MSDEVNAGIAIGGFLGTTVGGVPGMLAGSALGGLLGDAYSKKPSVGNHATTVQNDLAPENVTLDAHQIYVRITTGHGPDTLRAASKAAADLSERFIARAGQIAAARSKAAEAWQGDASTAADGATAPLSDSFAMAQEQLAANSQALNAEVAAFDHIRSQVEPVPATPPQSGIANSVNPFQTDVDAAINDYNAKAAKNVQLYEAYSADTAAARSQVAQSYAAPPPILASATATTRTGSPVGAAATAPPQVSPAADAGQPPATNASGAPGGAASAPPSTGSGSATPSATAGQGAAATDPSARPPTTTPNPAMPAARDTVTGGGPVAGPPLPPGTSTPQRKPTGAGPRAGGGVGSGAGVRGGTGTGGSTGMRGGPSVGNGPVPGQIPPGQQAGRGGVSGAAAARGAAGMGGMPMAPAGRANGEEDQEHRRKYLIQPDSKELFGTDEPYIRPVIGDNR